MWHFRITLDFESLECNTLSVSVFSKVPHGGRGGCCWAQCTWQFFPDRVGSLRIVPLPSTSFFSHLPCPSWSVSDLCSLFASSLLLNSYLRTPMRNWWKRFYICSWSCGDCWSPGWNSEITRTSFVFGKTQCLSHEWKVFAAHWIKIFKSVSGVLLEELKKKEQDPHY